MSANISMKQLLEAGVHFGHQTRRWNPKMARYIYGERNGIYIVDLQKTVKKLKEAIKYIRDLVATGEKLVFVGTKKQAKDAILEESRRCGMYFVNQRWLGGTLTNFQTLKKSIARLRELERLAAEEALLEKLSKKDRGKALKELAKLEKSIGGIKDMTELPGAIFVVDTKKEHNAILEARKLGIAIVGIVDTNCDPDEVDYIIPGNDDAIRAVRLIVSLMADAAIEGAEAYRTEQARQQAEADKAAGIESAPPAIPGAIPAEAPAAPAAPATPAAPAAPAVPAAKL
jgi:small subunit ribosomal protein S2